MADGLIAAPGFIDGHTHMDAQVACGFALAPDKPEDREWFARCLTAVEVNESPSDVLGILKHPRTLATFSDSGAHVCQEMGSSLQTHLLSYWVRNKQQFTLEEAVRMLTFDNASAWELPNCGLVRTGYMANLVVFDAQRIKPRLPTVEQDLPGGVRRLVQKADGIAATIVNGVVALENGETTGDFFGRVLKGRLAAVSGLAAYGVASFETRPAALLRMR